MYTIDDIEFVYPEDNPNICKVYECTNVVIIFGDLEEGIDPVICECKDFDMYMKRVRGPVYGGRGL